VITNYVNPAIRHTELVSDSTLHVVAVISNPARYHSRYRLAREFIAKMRATPNVKLHMVELAHGDRHFEVTSPGGTDLQLRSSNELWHKEAMINLGVRHLLPRDWRYLAWVDADVEFQHPAWALETIHQLQDYAVVQPFSEAIDMGPHGNALSLSRSFACGVNQGEGKMVGYESPYKFGHTGYAWACTRHFYENVGGLIDWAILGSSDHNMARALINDVDVSVHGSMTPAMRRKCHEWQTLAYRQTHGHLGYVPGHLRHYFHGRKSKRYYCERWQILVKHRFDPDVDLRRDVQGLYYIHNKPHLVEDVRQYMRSRHEDSIEED